MLEPLWSNAWDRVVYLLWSLGALESVATLGLHGLNQLLVDWLLQVRCLFYSRIEGEKRRHREKDV